MTERILEEFEQDIDDLCFLPSDGGVFEVVADDRLVYSKKATGRHADYDEVLQSLREHRGG
ncbi:MAG: SelT/SelW/SelH family protein [Actinobacteria bacterium]|nr:SelT/SelW/SelH family protein [Actinomycetota bacterium]